MSPICLIFRHNSASVRLGAGEQFLINEENVSIKSKSFPGVFSSNLSRKIEHFVILENFKTLLEEFNF
jgi:hypothetical protein